MLPYAFLNKPPFTVLGFSYTLGRTLKSPMANAGANLTTSSGKDKDSCDSERG